MHASYHVFAGQSKMRALMFPAFVADMSIENRLLAGVVRRVTRRASRFGLMVR